MATWQYNVYDLRNEISTEKWYSIKVMFELHFRVEMTFYSLAKIATENIQVNNFQKQRAEKIHCFFTNRYATRSQSNIKKESL